MLKRCEGSHNGSLNQRQSEQHWYSLTLLGYKEEVAPYLSFSLSLCAAASSSLPNFKSGVSTLIFSSPALRTQGKTEERDPGSFCHSHNSFASQRCLFSSAALPHFFLYNAMMRSSSVSGLHRTNFANPHPPREGRYQNQTDTYNYLKNEIWTTLTTL